MKQRENVSIWFVAFRFSSFMIVSILRSWRQLCAYPDSFHFGKLFYYTFWLYLWYSLGLNWSTV